MNSRTRPAVTYLSAVLEASTPSTLINLGSRVYNISETRLASPIGSAAGGSVNLSTSLSNVAKLAAHPKFVWVFNANCNGTIIYSDPV
jgi:hypothetical protein